MQKKTIPIICCLAASLYTTHSMAQSLDYASYGEMFEEPVTTSGNGSPQRLSEVALDMEIVTKDDIAKSGAQTIPEALRFLPGLSVRQISIGQTEIGIRGYNQADSSRILVLLNGRQVYDDLFGNVMWESIPVEMSEIQQIEVVKGPNTALFGFNAISGVINIITINPLYDDVKQIDSSVGIGREKLVSASGIYTQKFGDYALKLSTGGYNSTDDFKSLKDIGANADSQRRSISVDGVYKPNSKTEIWLKASDNTSNRNEYLVTRYADEGDIKVSSYRGTVLSDTDYGMINADAYYTETYQNLFNGEYNAKNKILVTKLNDTFEFDTDDIYRLGVEYREASNMYLPFDNAELQYKIAAVNGLWDWKASDKIRTSLALRYDHFELSPAGDNINSLIAGYPIAGLNLTANDYNQKRDEYSVNAGVSYQIDDKNTLKASYARGVDLPSFTEFGLQVIESVTTQRWSGNPYMKTSIVNNYEVDYSHVLNETGGKFKTALFYQTTSDVQGFSKLIVTDGTNYFSVAGNLGDSMMSGIELSIDGKFLKNWNWQANYTYLFVNDNLSNKMTSTSYQSPAEFEESSPNHVVNLVVGYNTEKWNAQVGLEYTSGYKDLLLSPTQFSTYYMHDVPQSVTMNANYSYNIVKGIDVSVSGQNLVGNGRQSVYSKTERQLWTSMKVKF